MAPTGPGRTLAVRFTCTDVKRKSSLSDSIVRSLIKTYVEECYVGYRRVYTDASVRQAFARPQRHSLLPVFASPGVRV